MKKICILCILLIANGLYGQKGQSITGRITDQKGAAVAFATLQLKPSDAAMSADDQGVFQFHNMTPGQYNLMISAVGFIQKSILVTVGNNPVDLQTIVLQEQISVLDQVVVTASRMEQTLADVPIPVKVISQEQITRSGNVRLDELLIEQTGLLVNSDHGTGIQIQGLNSEYILVLVDGEPLIGRTAGTLDLSRVTVNNIDRIEIVKGPSSSLYGSEAMGGVINIITKNPSNGLSATFGAKYRRFNSSDINAGVNYGTDKLQLNAFFNRLSSDGYDLTENSLSQTVSAFTASTYQVKSKYKISDQVDLSLSGRYYTEPQEDKIMVSVSDGQNTTDVLHDYNAKRTDWNILPKLEWRLRDKALITLRQYLSEYETETRITRNADQNLFSLDQFKQNFSRSEAQGDFFLNPLHTLTVGVGHIKEEVASTRYIDSTFTSQYAFVQYLWKPTESIDITLGGRYDDHEAYGSNFSPKVALGLQVNAKLKVRASFGGGFKAPDFRQLLLDFTNPTVGYSVMGTSVVTDGVARLIAQGETFRQDPVNNPNAIASARTNATVASNGLNAESSLAWNIGAHYQLNSKTLITGNLFRNNISNLIDTWAIAQKDNGQFIFSYRNVEDIVTQGVELETNLTLSPQLSISLGYQFLDTFDQKVVDQIEEGTLAYRPAGEIVSRRVKRSDYGGLFGRSKHSGNLKVNYRYVPLGLDLFFRTLYRGRWGFGDHDGNQILVGDDEYADGYFMFNLSLQKQFNSRFTIDAGVNNLLDTTNEFEASLPGRIWFIGLKINFLQQEK